MIEMMNNELQEMLKFVWKVKFPISKNHGPEGGET
jgi:hypothetical protein